MKSATAVFRSFPVPELFAILAMTALGAARVEAAPIQIRMNIPSITLEHGSDPEGVDDMSLSVDLDHYGPGAAGASVTMAHGQTLEPGWQFVGEVDPRGLASYKESDPFRYEFDVLDLTHEVAPGQWSYEYAVRNSDLSTFDVTGILIPGLWDLKPQVEPGTGFNIPATLSHIPPAEAFATIGFGDLSGTQKQVRVLAPVEIVASVPEPSTFALYGICVGAGWMLLGMMRKLPRGQE